MKYLGVFPVKHLAITLAILAVIVASSGLFVTAGRAHADLAGTSGWSAVCNGNGPAAADLSITATGGVLYFDCAGWATPLKCDQKFHGGFTTSQRGDAIAVQCGEAWFR